MSDILTRELKKQYDLSFRTIMGIVEAFPEDRWREPHPDEYYIPCRIAYHLAVVIDGLIAGGFEDKDFHSKLPYGNWNEATAESLPDKKEFLTYLEGAIDRAEKALCALSDEGLMSLVAPEKARLGESQIGIHMYLLRELADHTGELNKMLIENGKEDVWIFK